MTSVQPVDYPPEVDVVTGNGSYETVNIQAYPKNGKTYTKKRKCLLTTGYTRTRTEEEMGNSDEGPICDNGKHCTHVAIAQTSLHFV